MINKKLNLENSIKNMEKLVNMMQNSEVYPDEKVHLLIKKVEKDMKTLKKMMSNEKENNGNF